MSEITVTTPPGAVGPADVEVTNPDGQVAVFAGGFVYNAPAPVIASVSPGNGPVAGGTEIVVVGADFEPGAVVTVGGVEAPAVAPPVEPLVPGIWPDNEPVGLSPVFPGHPTVPGVLLDGSEHRFDYTAQGGSDLGSGLFFSPEWDGGPRVLSTTSPGSKYPSVIRKNTFIGDVDGWNGIASARNFAANYEALYFRMVVRFSDNYQFNGASDKLLYWGEANNKANDFYLAIQSSGGGKVLTLRNQAAGGGDRGGEWRSRTLIHDLPSLELRTEWHTVELLIHAQSALGVADGSFQLWFDGVGLTDFDWLHPNRPDPGQNAIEWYGSGYTTRLFSGIQFPLYWGGSSGTKTVNDYIDISEVYITGKSAVS